MSKRPYISLIIVSRASKYETYLKEIMAYESFVEHLVGLLHFLQQTLFLRFSQISMSLAIYLYLWAGFLACQGWLVFVLKTFDFSVFPCGSFVIID